MWGAIAGGLLGLFGANKAEKREDAAIAAQNIYNHPLNIRRRAEKAGVNPLLFMGPGVGLQNTTGGTNYMGSAIADFGQMMGSMIDAKVLAKQNAKNQAVQRKAKSEQKLTRMALNPKVDGIYASRMAAPSRAAALGLVNPNAGSSVPVLPASSGLGTLPGTVVLPANVGPSGAPDQAITPVQSTYVTHNGEEFELPEGVDLEDVATGYLMNWAGTKKRRYMPWNSSSPAVRREYTRSFNKAARAKFFAPTVPLASEASKMPTKTPWWMMDQSFIDKSAKVRTTYEWPQRPGYQSLRWQ